VVHDHPGAAASADSWLAVGFGPGTWQDYGFFQLKYGSTPRYDLGLLELFFTVALALAFSLTWHRASTRGWYVAVACTLYAPVRFCLDFLRSRDLADGGDERYAALTPAQWGCVVMFAFGAWLLARLAQSRPLDDLTVPELTPRALALRPHAAESAGTSDDADRRQERGHLK
jgi:phosphatidylglycerol:prolipoprotein diacylglycerol transferase